MNENRPKHSGFEAPERFEVLPRGTKFKKNPDGTITLIPPKEQNDNEPIETPKHSGFEAPAYGVMDPKGTKYKKNPDGTISPIYPKQKEPTEE